MKPAVCVKCLATLSLLAFLPAIRVTQAAEEYFADYQYLDMSQGVDVATQPNAYPISYLTALMQRDRILRRQMPAVAFHPFRKGNDILHQLGDAHVEASIFGDMPTLLAVINERAVIVGLAKKNFSSIVARSYTRVEQLRGKRIAYSPNSTAHYVLMKGLAASDMGDKDVVLVPMEPAAMPEALATGKVDAFAAWEPTPTIALTADKRNRAIYKGMSTVWMVFSADFIQEQPARALDLVASYVRALNWLRASRRNLERATAWVLQDSERFSGQRAGLSAAQAADIARKDMLDVPEIPLAEGLERNLLPLAGELAFLKSQGKVEPTADEAALAKAFAYSGLQQVLKAPKRFRVYEYDYAD